MSQNKSKLLESAHSEGPHSLEYVSGTIVPQTKAFLKEAEGVQDVLEVLEQTNPEDHAALWVLVLAKELRMELRMEPERMLMLLYALFDGLSTGQVAVVEEEFDGIMHLLNFTLTSIKSPLLLNKGCSNYLLQTLVRAIERVEELRGRKLWPLHARAVELAYSVKAYIMIKPIVHTAYTEGTQAVKMTKQDLFLYHFYAGSILLELREYRLANEALSIALTMEHKQRALCLNRWKLSAIYMHGPGPYAASGEYEPQSEDRRLEYGSFVHAFVSSGSYEQLEREFMSHQDAFRSNHDLTAAQDGLDRFKELRLLNLKRSFMSIDLGLMKKIEPSLTEMHVLQLLNRGALDAQLSVTKTGDIGIEFTSTQSTNQLQKLEAELQNVIELSKHVEHMNRHVVQSENFFKGLKRRDLQSRARKMKSKGAADFVDDTAEHIWRRKLDQPYINPEDLAPEIDDNPNHDDDDDDDESMDEVA
ncbi:hypothetical protein TRICI_002906 [Trichomonascus ciferrii]|uniref:COP9 signalosome complex subunit 3 N-terminal helical repeats domain-containing protein n=1 Tax=Trichomonascus ciferrii TaxID=44093 RepID=A0A642V5K1_9ASCO|nr:hypothetical protein TRICI_002906 [Trichomonascus ciferrii]